MALSPPPTPPPHSSNLSPLQRLTRKSSEMWFFPLRIPSKRTSSSSQSSQSSPNPVTFLHTFNNSLSNYARPSMLLTHAPESPQPSLSSQLMQRPDKEDIKRSRSFAYGSQPRDMLLLPKKSTPLVYAAFLSRVAEEFERHITVGDRCKDGIEYKNTFTGSEAVDCLTMILATGDRFLAMIVGRAMGAQRFFHDVRYEQRLLDSEEELYQLEVMLVNQKHDFPDSPTTLVSPTITESSGGSVHDLDLPERPFPHGVVTELTYCYSPTCYGDAPCYSVFCPKRPSQLKRETLAQPNLPSQDHPLWADIVPPAEYSTIPRAECKRQEHIYELIYTESNYVKDLEYLNEMWIQPLTNSDIIPVSRRAHVLESIFANVLHVYAVNSRFRTALLARQKESTVIHDLGDILLEFTVDFEPYIYYGARQHEAKFALEQERAINPEFDKFANQIERHPRSKKLELNGYLSKPTTRLGRYTLLLAEVLKRTPTTHPDHDKITKSIAIIKQFLVRVNAHAGRMKNRFDLEQLHLNLSFKNKADAIDLDLLKEGRLLIKEGMLKKNASADSTEYQVILLDHYVLVTKAKMSRNGNIKYIVQYPPMALDLLTVLVPRDRGDDLLDGLPSRGSLSSPTTSSPPAEFNKRGSSSSILPYVNVNSSSPVLLRPYNSSAISDSAPSEYASPNLSMDRKPGYPVVFDYLGRRCKNNFLVLYASSEATRRPWIEKVIKQQQERLQNTQPIFRVLPAVGPGHSLFCSQGINHLITFNKGQHYILATDHGVYVGHMIGDKTPHQILALPKVTQVQVIESAQLLLVLSERTLWEYPLTAVNNKPDMQFQGKRVQSHVPFFHVGRSLQRTMVCVPRVSTLKSTITVYEPVHDHGSSGAEPSSLPSSPLPSSRQTDHQLVGLDRKKSILTRMPLIRRQSASHLNLRLKRLKDMYIPSDVWAIELSPTKMLITSPRGMILVDMNSDKPQQLLDPADRNLTFVTERERDDLSHIRQPHKHIAIFRTPRGDHFVCYDEYGFYIDSKGNRLYPKFLIEWEGHPEAFAYQYPYIIAFDQSFIEIRHIVTGELAQIIRGSHIRCLNNGYKTEVPMIFGVMNDDRQYPQIFQLQMIPRK
ncbi:hypothetical protein DM01DRAFT_1219091 [Hesseltinella vesiculosa]|uniref:CNH-domain-containing protein n=1 Tax=Hesseltinella vesiculosa TaxID=101127 RepID=A0A1X2GNX0_9FUNG|nr:hypothetical protein DM01DRAFT_1219091 [Hesseltinella vesiculosa]